MESKKLLMKLMDTIRIAHADMGCKHRYTLTHMSMPVVTEILAFLSKPPEQVVDTDAFCGRAYCSLDSANIGCEVKKCDDRTI